MLKLHRPSSCTLALFPRQPSRKFVPQHPLQAIKSCRHRSLSRSVGLSKGRPLGARSATEASVSGRGSAAPEPPSLAVFVSGGGSNFRAIHKAVLEGQIAARVAVVVSDVPQCGACEYAAEEGIPIIAYPASLSKAEASHDHNAETPEELTQLLTAVYRVQFVLLAGYLKLIPKEVVAAFPRAMLNIHPGLLPAFAGKGFYGSRVHRAVIASGARFTGPTVHFVDDNYDTGPILAQRVIPVAPLEDHKQLAARVLVEEHKLYPEAVAALVENRISWREDGVPIIWTAQ